MNYLHSPERSTLGCMGWNALIAIGVRSPEELRARDPFEVFATLSRMKLARRPDMLQALIAACEIPAPDAKPMDERYEIARRAAVFGASIH